MTLSPLGTFGIGPYSATYATNPLGLTTSEGWRVRYRPSVTPINDTNLYGDCLIDGVYRGLASVQLIVTFKEWTTYVKNAIYPYGAAGIFDGSLGTGTNVSIGTLQSTFAKTLVLSAISGSTAYTNGPVSLTALGAVISPDNDVEILLGPDERNIPVIFDLLLTATGGTNAVPGWFTVT